MTNDDVCQYFQWFQSQLGTFMMRLVVTNILYCHFFVFLPHLSFCLSHPISPLAPPPSISPLCLMLQPFHQKENGKTANPAACYGIRVYQPIMPFSDLFSSQDLSLCACIPPPPPTHTFPLSPNKGSGCYIFSSKTSCNITPPPPTP